MATTILTSDNPQTKINANANIGEVFTFQAGTHSISALLTPSANSQEFQGATDGTPVSVTPLDPLGVSLGKTKEMWSSGTPTSIMDGGSGTYGFMGDFSSPINWTGIIIRKLKMQNFDPPRAGQGVVGGRYTQDWVIEDNWIVGGDMGVKLGQSMKVRRNRINDSGVWWLQGFEANGIASNRIIIEDNEVFDINVSEIQDPQFDASFKISRGDYVTVRRNYARDCHGPAIWFDGHNDFISIHDSITVDCGLHDDGGTQPHIFYEINPAHGGANINNNWVLGRAAVINISHSHGNGSNYVEVYENTVDCDDGNRQGINLKDDQHGGGGDSTGSHPAINTVALGSGEHFADRIRFYDNVVRKRNSSFASTVPLAGMSAGGGDAARNYEFTGNKYEVNSAISAPFAWAGATKTWTQWKTLRAATGDVQNTGPFFDTTGAFVTWSGTKQFADTPNNWENAAAGAAGGFRIGVISI